MKGKILGRKTLEQVTTIVTPDTILRWHREWIAAKWDYSEHRKKIGRPPVSTEIVELVLRMASENPGCGYNRIQGALANLGHLISNTCVRNILKARGIDPAPDRKGRPGNLLLDTAVGGTVDLLGRVMQDDLDAKDGDIGPGPIISSRPDDRSAPAALRAQTPVFKRFHPQMELKAAIAELKPGDFHLLQA